MNSAGKPASVAVPAVAANERTDWMDALAPDDKAVEVWSLWLRRGWNDAETLLWRIQRYARLTLGPIQHFPGDQAHYGPCTDTVWLDGSNVMGLS